MSTKKQCESGLTKHERKAVRDWLRLKKTRSPGSVSSSVPAPPAPNTPAYRCMSKWVYCWQEAQIIDSLNLDIQKLQAQLAFMKTLKPYPAKQIQQLATYIAGKQQEVRKRMIALAAQKLAYLNCVKGIPV